MNIKEELYKKRYIDTSDEKSAFRQMNSHVIRLLQDKLLPLRREKYKHLQKINLALRKDKNFLKTQQTHSLHKIRLKKTGQSKFRSGMTSRTSHKDITQQILFERLKKMSNLSLSTPRLSNKGKLSEYLQKVEEKMADFQKQSVQQIYQQEHYFKKSKTSRKRQPFLDIALKAERHLRMRKHELRQKYLDEHEGKRTVTKTTDFQKKQNHLKQIPFKMTSEAQLQRQLLADIRQTMLEEKINKIKRDINHKKIVQLR